LQRSTLPLQLRLELLLLELLLLELMLLLVLMLLLELLLLVLMLLLELLLLVLMLLLVLKHMLSSISSMLPVLVLLLELLLVLVLVLMLMLLLVLVLEHMLSSISSMPLRTAVQQRRKRIRQRRQRCALQHRQRQQQPVERCEKLCSAAQPRRNARGVVGEDVERDRGEHRRPRHARRQPLALLVCEHSERQRQIRQLYSDRRQPTRSVPARRGEGALDAQRAWCAQQQY